MQEDSKHLSRIRECFPSLTIGSVELNQDGLTNDVLIINNELVCRFPKNDTWAQALLDNELKVLDLLRAHLDIPIPEVEYRAEDFVVYRFINGTPLQRNDILVLDEQGQEQVVNQLATFLRQMHEVPPGEVEQHRIAQSDVNRNREVWIRLFEDVQRELFPVLMPHARDWVKNHFEPALEERSQ